MKKNFKIPKEEPETPLVKAQAAKNKGNKYFKTGKYEDAIVCYDEAIKICPKAYRTDLSISYQNRAAAYEQLKNWKNVVRDCTSALELNDWYYKAYQRRAKACEILNDLEQALEDFIVVRVIEEVGSETPQPDIDRVSQDLGRQLAAEAMKHRVPFMPSKHFICSHFDSFAEEPIFESRYREKQSKCANSDHRHPQKNKKNKSRRDRNPEVASLSQLQSDLDAVASVAASWNLNLNPNKSAVLRFSRGFAEPLNGVKFSSYLDAKNYFLEGHYNDACESCSSELADPTSPYESEALLLRATIYYLRMEKDRAREDLDTLINMDNVPPKVLVNAMIKRGTLHLIAKKMDDGMKVFKKAAAIDPLNSDPPYHIAKIHFGRGNMVQAITYFQKAIDLNANFPCAVIERCCANFRYASVFGCESMINKVMSDFETAIKKFPTFGECYASYAQMLFKQGKFEKADELYLKAIEVDPDNSWLYVHRALLLKDRKQDMNQVKSLFMQAVEMDSQCDLAYENLGVLEIDKDNFKGGIAFIDKAITYAKNEKELAHYLAMKSLVVARKKMFDKLKLVTIE